MEYLTIKRTLSTEDIYKFVDLNDDTWRKIKFYLIIDTGDTSIDIELKSMLKWNYLTHSMEIAFDTFDNHKELKDFIDTAYVNDSMTLSYSMHKSEPEHSVPNNTLRITHSEPVYIGKALYHRTIEKSFIHK